MARRRWWAGAASAIALALSVATLAGSQSPDVVHGGLGAQRLPITLSVAADGRTLSLDITWTTTCGGLVRTIRSAATRVADDGTFAWTGTDVIDEGDGDEDRHRLSLAGRREDDGALSGVWRGERDAYNGQGRSIDATCSSGDVAFTVVRGGATAQPDPRREAAGQLVTALGYEPEYVATGAGRTWVRGRDAVIASPARRTGSVSTIDQLSGRAVTASRLDVGLGASYFAAAGDAAWLLTGYTQARLLRIDGRTRAIVRGPRLPTGAGIAGLAAGAGGVWVTAGDRVLRADPRDGRLVRSIRVPADRRFRNARRCSRTTHMPLVAMHRGAPWVLARTFINCRLHAAPQSFALQRAGALHSLVRIDPRTNRVTRAVTLTREYGRIAFGPSGIWGVGCAKPTAGDCRRPVLHRIDGRTGRPTLVVMLPATPPQHQGISGVAAELAAGAGAVWIVQATEPYASRRSQTGVLRRLDLATRRLTDVRAIARLPADLAVDAHGAWMIDDSDRALVRVEP